MEKPKPFFQTSNCQLAAALALAGIPWLDPNEPLQTEYDAEYLDANGCKTIAEAREKKKPGRFAFHFQPVAELNACLQQFDRTKKEVDACFEKGIEVDFLEKLTPAARVEIAAKVLAIAALVKDARYKVPPWLMFWKDGDTETIPNSDGSTTVRTPGFTRYRKDAPAHIIEKLS